MFYTNSIKAGKFTNTQTTASQFKSNTILKTTNANSKTEIKINNVITFKH